jgi:hypothetical protein
MLTSKLRALASWPSLYVNTLAESWGFEPQIPLEGILA